MPDILEQDVWASTGYDWLINQEELIYIQSRSMEKRLLIRPIRHCWTWLYLSAIGYIRPKQPPCFMEGSNPPKEKIYNNEQDKVLTRIRLES